MNHKMHFARTMVLWALLACVFLLAGCTEPPHRVTVWHPYRGAEETALRRNIERFEVESGARVTVLAVPYEAYLSKLEAAIPRGNGPDVFIGPHNRLGEYLRHQLVAPVDSALGDPTSFERATIEAVTFDGVKFAVPLASKCVALYYNPRVLAEPPKSLAHLAARRGEFGPGVWPLAYEAQSPYYHAAILHAFGGKLFDNDFAMEGSAAEASLRAVQALLDAHVIPEEPSGDLVKTLFSSGKAAAVISGPWLAAELSSDVEFRIAPLPTVDDTHVMRPFLTVDGAFLTPQGARDPQAAALLRSLGTRESAKERAEIGKQVVATSAYWRDASSDALSAKDQAILSAFHAASKDAVPMSAQMAMNPVWSIAEQAIRSVLRKQSSAHDALAQAHARYTDVMRPPPPASSPTPYLAAVGILLLFAAIKLVQRVRHPSFSAEISRSLPAYKYVTHAAVTVLVLVVFPLVAGASMSLFAGGREDARFVGFANYIEILTARGKPLLSQGSFYLTLIVTVAWTVANVACHLALGLGLGTLLARPALKLRAAYRVLLVLPWAVPSYVTALAWKGMFHRQFGSVSAILSALGIEPISWFSRFSTAFAANVATNVWLGFPFMMVVVMGALTSIPQDVLEAASVDGATRWQSFRKVTLPLLKPTLLPAVVLGSVWTFNMFNVVFLVSGGEPDGSTDILVSEAYRWAFARNAQIGYAAAYSVIIFGLLALMSRVGDRIGREGSA